MKTEDQKKFLELRNKIVELLREGEKIEASGSLLCASALNELYAGFGKSYFIRSTVASKCEDFNFPYNCS